MEKKITGFPSIDKPWLKYYKEPVTELNIPKCSFYENLRSCAGEFAEYTALEYLGIKISYKKMFEKIDQTAKALLEAGVREKEIVSVCLPNTPEAVYLVYAINKIGAVANMIDLRCGEKWLKKALAESKSNVLICLDSVAEKFDHFLKKTEVKTAVAVSPVESHPVFLRKMIVATHPNLKSPVPSSFISWKQFVSLAKKHKGSIETPFVEDTEAVIAYTGGTTGDPKGVVGTNENIVAQFVSQSLFGHDCTAGDRILTVAPPWTYYGLCNSLNNCLCVGSCVVLIPKAGPDELGKQIRTLKPNGITTVPSALTGMINEPTLKDVDLSFIKYLIVGADKLDETLEEHTNRFLREHNCKVCVSKGYGMTEVMAAAACSIADGTLGSVGIPTPGMVISAFSEGEDGIIQECRIGEQGELAILSPCIMKTYFGEAKSENSLVLKKHPDGKIWAHTGDIGYVGEDGRIYISGRLKRMFVRNGYKVFPSTIEKCIDRHPAVLQSAVVSVSDPTMGFITKAVIVLNPGESDNEKVEQELKGLLSDELYDYEWPDVYEFVDFLPLTGMGKVDYRALEDTRRSGGDGSSCSAVPPVA